MGRPVADVPDVCIDTGIGLLNELLTSRTTTRADALDLLVVDALITYAFQEAAGNPMLLDRRASAAMSRIAALSTGPEE